MSARPQTERAKRSFHLKKQPPPWFRAQDGLTTSTMGSEPPFYGEGELRRVTSPRHSVVRMSCFLLKAFRSNDI